MENSNKEAAEQFTPQTATNCYLNYLDSKCLFFLVEEILKTLQGENNLTDVEKEYWLSRLTTYREMSSMSLEMVKNEVEFYNREQAINALIPFVKNAHLN